MKGGRSTGRSAQSIFRSREAERPGLQRLPWGRGIRWAQGKSREGAPLYTDTLVRLGEQASTPPPDCSPLPELRAGPRVLAVRSPARGRARGTLPGRAVLRAGMGAGRGASSGDSPGQLAVSAGAPAAGDPAHRPQRCRAGAVPAVADEVAGSAEALTVRPSASAGPRAARGPPAPPAGERAPAPRVGPQALGVR